MLGWGLRAGAVFALVVASGCASYVGNARPFDRARVTREAGWITAGPVQPVRQRQAADCGPAALSMVAGRWEMPLSLETAMAAIPDMTEHGAKLGNLRHAARELGLLAFVIRGDRSILTHELRQGRPVVVGLLQRHRRRRIRSHYEVVVAMHPERGEVVTLDPASGWRVRHWEDLEDEWKPAGRPALVVLGPDFRQAVRTEPAARSQGVQ
jgi:ABC-type bacteriocin/lantibiotic exporter with double-glycine peptidase domain